jgi:hypothetical protein
MNEQVIIRFRDLVTELGGTIEDHRAILQSFGEVWWGWFMQPYEVAPRVLFGQMREHIRATGPMKSMLFDTGQALLYSCIIADIKVSPSSRGISSPDPERSPEYYHRGRYPAWFLLRSIESVVAFDALGLTYRGFPTRPELTGTLGALIGHRIQSPSQLREAKVTLWVVNVEQ